MYAKLALRNIKRSLRDYAVYFLTIVFAVAVFYVFGTMADQPVIAGLDGESGKLAGFLVIAISYISIFIAVIMAILVLYANNFLVKKRQREIGTYLLLGMRQKSVARLLFIESVIIGLVSLVVGIVVGIVLSQGFSLVVAYFFNASIDHMEFVFSASALVRSVLLFGFIYLVAGLLSSLSIVRFKLIDLITGDKKNEVIRLGRPIVSFTAGIISLAVIGYAYWLAVCLGKEMDINPFDPRFWQAAVMGILGTYGVFYAFSGLIIGIFKRFKGIYFKGLNMFVLRQVTCKVAGNARLLATISLMLTVTLCSFAVGLGINTWMKSMINMVAPDDIVVKTTNTNMDMTPIYIEAARNSLDYSQRVDVVYHKSGIMQTALVAGREKQDVMKRKNNNSMPLKEQDTSVISLSDYNALRVLKKMQPISMSEREYAVQSFEWNKDYKPAMDRQLAAASKLSIGGELLKPSKSSVYTEPLWGFMSMDDNQNALIIVDDAIAEKLPTVSRSVFIDYAGESDGQVDAKMEKSAKTMLGDAGTFISQSQIRESFGGVSAIFVFVDFYIGVIFLIASAAVLAIQQLADASDHRRRFEMIRKLGSDDKMISRALLKQISFYFLIPCAVGLVHAAVGLYALNKMFLFAEGFSLAGSFFIATVISLIVYGIYYIATYLGYRSILKYSSL